MAAAPSETTQYATPKEDAPWRTWVVAGLLALLGSAFFTGGIFQIKHQLIAGMLFLVLGGACLGGAFYVYSRSPVAKAAATSEQA
ncbi:MAG TPA: hypothetical protein VNZ52_06990 [Candidatus Thermoplasmatota archaeon]|nr:hypothetical protein [Candidatus Thermoplasmatota archaeon]